MSIPFRCNQFWRWKNYIYENDENIILCSVKKSLRMYNLHTLISSLKILPVLSQKYGMSRRCTYVADGCITGKRLREYLHFLNKIWLINIDILIVTVIIIYTIKIVIKQADLNLANIWNFIYQYYKLFLYAFFR